jgi:hypothetical protein
MSLLPADDMRAMLVQMLAGATDTPAVRWDQILGPMVHVVMTKSPSTNWTIGASLETEAERAAIIQAIVLAHEAHPNVGW